ncbi:hypothetical protein ABPG75_007208 [Micractinium tetrahymenae]
MSSTKEGSGRRHQAARRPPGRQRDATALQTPSFFARLDLRQSYMPMAVLVLVAVVRCWQVLTPATAAWLLAYITALLAAAAWQACRPASFPRHRELAAALLRLTSVGLGLGWALSCRFLDGLDTSARPVLLQRLAALLPQAAAGPGGALLGSCQRRQMLPATP